MKLTKKNKGNMLLKTKKRRMKGGNIAGNIAGKILTGAKLTAKNIIVTPVLGFAGYVPKNENIKTDDNSNIGTTSTEPGFLQKNIIDPASQITSAAVEKVTDYLALPENQQPLKETIGNLGNILAADIQVAANVLDKPEVETAIVSSVDSAANILNKTTQSLSPVVEEGIKSVADITATGIGRLAEIGQKELVTLASGVPGLGAVIAVAKTVDNVAEAGETIIDTASKTAEANAKFIGDAVGAASTIENAVVAEAGNIISNISDINTSISEESNEEQKIEQNNEQNNEQNTDKDKEPKTEEVQTGGRKKLFRTMKDKQKIQNRIYKSLVGFGNTTKKNKNKKKIKSTTLKKVRFNL